MAPHVLETKIYGWNKLLSVSALPFLLLTWRFPYGDIHTKIDVLGNVVMSSKQTGKMTLCPVSIKDAPTGQETALTRWNFDEVERMIPCFSGTER